MDSHNEQEQVSARVSAGDQASECVNNFDKRLPTASLKPEAVWRWRNWGSEEH